MFRRGNVMWAVFDSVAPLNIAAERIQQGARFVDGGHDDDVMEMPQSGERIRGREDMRAMQEINAAYSFLKPQAARGGRDTASPRVRGLPVTLDKVLAGLD